MPTPSVSSDGRSGGFSAGRCGARDDNNDNDSASSRGAGVEWQESQLSVDGVEKNAKTGDGVDLRD